MSQCLTSDDDGLKAAMLTGQGAEEAKPSLARGRMAAKLILPSMLRAVAKGACDPHAG